MTKVIVVDGYKKISDDEREKLRIIFSKADVIINYSLWEKDRIQKPIIELAGKVSTKNAVVVYGAPIQLGGGGGWIPPLIDYTWEAVSFVILAGAQEYIGELVVGKAKVIIELLTKASKKSSMHKSFSIKRFTKSGISIKYLFTPNLTTKDGVEAFKKMEKHFSKLNKRQNTNDVNYIFDRKDRTWVSY